MNKAGLTARDVSCGYVERKFAINSLFRLFAVEQKTSQKKRKFFNYLNV